MSSLKDLDKMRHEFEDNTFVYRRVIGDNPFEQVHFVIKQTLFARLVLLRVIAIKSLKRFVIELKMITC